MINQFLENQMPKAPLKIIVMDSIRELGSRVNDYLVQYRKEINQPHHKSPAFEDYRMENYIVNLNVPRLGSGEAKAMLGESVRGKDLYLMTDVLNYSLTYKLHGYENMYSPDDHYQDLKRVIGAVAGKAHRITVIMPFMYESRQHKRAGRESLDCAMMLDELADMGISGLITFDAHDPSIQSAAPLCSFDNFTPFYQFIRCLFENVGDMKIDKKHTLIISPDEGAMHRAIYFASVLGLETGTFYKRRDYSTVKDGKNPLVEHQFLGDSVEGMDVIIVDDMISSGGSMLDTAKQLKRMKARRVFICCTFGIFTDGLADFDKAFDEGYFDRVITTNLCYRRPELLGRPWYLEADMAKFIASIIDFSNHDVSLDKVRTPTEKIHKIVERYNSTEGPLR